MSDTRARPGREDAATRTVQHRQLPATWRDSAGDDGAPVAAPALAPGALVKHYEIIRELGRGGMARVMLARDLKLGRKVALKFLDAASPRMSASLLVEARATARCSHENIVIIHEVDEHDGRPFMAFELLEGQSLARLLAESGALPPRRALELVIPVVSALVHAHSLDIVHRDLKPENIFVTSRGAIKVLDFGIAKLFAPVDPASALPDDHSIAGGGALSGLVGTLPYMAPEQWRTDEVDERTDVWAVGIILWQMLAGHHPLDPISHDKLIRMATSRRPMPSIASALPNLPSALERAVDRCLAKRKEDRHLSARELLDELLVLTPGSRRAADQDAPYLGLRAFQEADADRFHGREREVTHFLARLRETPLLGLIGPSGAGKSSFVQAGVVPALRGSGADWEVMVVRPGRDPLASLAALIQPTGSSIEPAAIEPATVDRLRAEPGRLGAALRDHAHRKGERVLLFVDQLEELYTLVDDPAVRRAFTACLAGAADDWSSPVRVIVSIRSDFVDRVNEDRAFMDVLSRGLVFLPPPDREGLRDALVQPLDAAGYRFEDPGIAEELVDSIQSAAGALPLLQFTAAGLWEARDRDRRVITRASHEARGGVAGALADHADRVLSSMAPHLRRITRALFQRLVTADRTRAAVTLTELTELAEPPRDVETVVDLLIGARLLVVQGGGDGADRAVEIVHESLIQRWPTLRRWLDERSEDGVFLDHLREAARKWDAHARPQWLLLTADAADEARRFTRRYKGPVGPLERAFLDAVVDRAARAARRRRGLVVGAFAVLVVLVAASTVAMFRIRGAERLARERGAVARAEADRALAAERVVREQLVALREQELARQRAERQRASAVDDATRARTEVELGREQLARVNQQLRGALERASAEIARSAQLAIAERTAKENNAALLERERRRVRELEEKERRISTELR